MYCQKNDFPNYPVLQVQTIGNENKTFYHGDSVNFCEAYLILKTLQSLYESYFSDAYFQFFPLALLVLAHLRIRVCNSELRRLPCPSNSKDC